MARTPDPNSATAQFFINVNDNKSLNFREPTPQGYGYVVFGKVIQGMDVVNKIATAPTAARPTASGLATTNRCCTSISGRRIIRSGPKAKSR